MSWRFTIIDRDNVSTEIEEPPGWDKNKADIKRDLDKHGLSFTTQGDEFEYYNTAMHLLKNEWDAYMYEGDMTLLIEEDCGNGYEEYSREKFDFTGYEFVCGDNCYVKIPVEKSGETMELTNRISQKVNLEALKTFDLTTDLVPYSTLPFTMSLPSKGIFLQDKAQWNEEAITTVSLNEVPNIFVDATVNIPNWGWFQIVPQFEKETFSEFGKFTTAFTPENHFIKSGLYDLGPDPAYETVVNALFTPGPDTRRIYFDWPSASPLLYNDLSKNNFDAVNEFSLDIDYSFELQLNYAMIASLYNVVVIRRKDGTFEYLDRERIFSAAVGGGYAGMNNSSVWMFHSNHTVSFSKSYTGIHLDEGDYLFTAVCGLSSYFQQDATNGLEAYKIRSLSGSVTMETLSTSEPTDSKVFAINEAISRVAESITNDKLRGYSEYFGRTDSEPYSVAEDGCGSLEVITDGIRIRRQENKIPGTTNLFTVSLQDIFDILNPIHNIGMGIEPDTNRTGFNRLRVEPWYYFYNDTLIMSCPDVGQITRRAYEKDAFSTFQFGYAKWEAEEYNGLDEFLTKRIYRTTLSQIKNDLVKLSKGIASGYAIEITKRKGNDNTKDWRYDKETFIICCERNESAIVVELGNVLDPENIIDPDTIYNYRISPIRNAMRWMNKVFASYRQFGVECQLIFTDGDGNYFAKGQMEATNCRLENDAIAENQTIDLSIYDDTDNAKPILLPERVLFEYPMSTADYRAIKANPYGQIYFSNDCEEGYGYIDTINYLPEEGRATFNLIPKAM